MKKVKTYHDVEFHKHEIYNIADRTGDEFQYEKFNEFNEVDIDIDLFTSSNDSIKDDESAV